MRAVHEKQLLGPARYILSLVEADAPIRYSEHIYDGSTELHNRVVEQIKLADLSDADIIESLLDEAADQLEEQGFLTVTELDTKLLDGSNDFVIALTAEGRKVLEGKSAFDVFERFYELDRPPGYRILQ